MNHTHTEKTSSPPLTSPFYISWSAIVAGVLITFVLQLLFTLLGAGIGAASIQPLNQDDPAKGFGIGSAIWLLVSALIAMYFGAGAAGRLSASANILVRRLHGILTWGAVTVVGFVLLATSLGAMLGGAGSLLGGATAAATAAHAPQAQAAYSGTPTAIDAANNPSVTAANSVLSPTGRDDQALRAQNEQKARQAADMAAKRVSQAALWSFLVLICSGLVAMFAGTRSKPWGPITATRESYEFKTQPAI